MSVVASRYAKSLWDVLYPSRTKMGRDQLRSFLSVISSQDGARLILDNPALPTETRKDLLEQIANVLHFDPLIRNFLGLLIDGSRLDLVEEIVAAYENLLDESKGEVKAGVTASPDVYSRLREEISGQ